MFEAEILSTSPSNVHEDYFSMEEVISMIRKYLNTSKSNPSVKSLSGCNCQRRKFINWLKWREAVLRNTSPAKNISKQLKNTNM